MQSTSGFLSDGVAAILAWASEPQAAANSLWLVATVALTALAGVAVARITAMGRRLAPVKVRKHVDPRRVR
jgi:hypothetical protein